MFFVLMASFDKLNISFVNLDIPLRPFFLLGLKETDYRIFLVFVERALSSYLVCQRCDFFLKRKKIILSVREYTFI